MSNRTHALPIVRQCQIRELARSTAYDPAPPVSPDELALLCRIDELPLEHPVGGARMLSKMRKRAGQSVGRRRVSTTMKRRGIHALYRKPNTSQRHPAHPVYPSLLRHLTSPRSHHVWAADIRYIPMQRGFVYLVAVIDWARRRVLSGRLSNTLTTDFCLDAVPEASNRDGKPAIFNTDPGCQFTSLDFTGLLKEHGIQVSMDGQGCWRDHVFVERRWKSVKYEAVYLHAYECGSDARKGLDTYCAFYNQSRPHTALDDQTPDEFYFENLPARSRTAEANNRRATLMKTELLSNQAEPLLYTARSTDDKRRGWSCPPRRPR